jgi:hypothetical protein
MFDEKKKVKFELFPNMVLIYVTIVINKEVFRKCKWKVIRIILKLERNNTVCGKLYVGRFFKNNSW